LSGGDLLAERQAGYVTTLTLTGGEEIGLYQPKHPRPTHWSWRRRAA
jgi:hypothetical protein